MMYKARYWVTYALEGLISMRQDWSTVLLQLWMVHIDFLHENRQWMTETYDNHFMPNFPGFLFSEVLDTAFSHASLYFAEYMFGIFVCVFLMVLCHFHNIHWFLQATQCLENLLSVHLVSKCFQDFHCSYSLMLACIGFSKVTAFVYMRALININEYMLCMGSQDHTFYLWILWVNSQRQQLTSDYSTFYVTLYHWAAIWVFVPST